MLHCGDAIFAKAKKHRTLGNNTACGVLGSKKILHLRPLSLGSDHPFLKVIFSHNSLRRYYPYQVKGFGSRHLSRRRIRRSRYLTYSTPVLLGFILFLFFVFLFWQISVVEIGIHELYIKSREFFLVYDDTAVILLKLFEEEVIGNALIEVLEEALVAFV